jgi:RNA-directed DNA polymerase
MMLEPIYGRDFSEGSYGFRPGRGAHQALGRLWKETMNTGGGWVLEVDISKFFDTLDHGHLRQLVQHRVRDGVLLRLIGKWLNAGVMEAGEVSHPDAGSPQGGVISPPLSAIEWVANIYLHYVLDEWFEREVQPRMAGRAYLIRYADDFVIGFANEEDARRVQDVLPKRFGKYGLTIHPGKTRLVRFKKPSDRKSPTGEPERSEPPESFDLLGFTHYWGRSRKGIWVVKRKTSSKRPSRGLRAINQRCRANLHRPLVEQQQALGRKLRGHCAYYGITGNSKCLSAFRLWVTRIWRRWLSRRNRERGMTWDRFNQLLDRYPLPPALAIHSDCRPAAKP